VQGVGLEKLLNAENVAVHADLDAELVAILPGMVLVNWLAAVDGIHVVKARPVNDLAALFSGDAAVVGLIYGIVSAVAVARIITAAEAEVNVYVNFRLSLLNRRQGGKRNSNSGCSDEGLGDHFRSPGFKFLFRCDDPIGHP
jgi:hypothetical protein